MEEMKLATLFSIEIMKDDTIEVQFSAKLHEEDLDCVIELIGKPSQVAWRNAKKE